MRTNIYKKIYALGKYIYLRAPQFYTMSDADWGSKAVAPTYSWLAAIGVVSNPYKQVY